MTPRHVVLCEGYHDRSFVAGWLLRRGWTDPGERSNGERAPVQDPSGQAVAAGTFAYWSPGRKSFLSVKPVHGASKLLPELKRLQQRAEVLGTVVVLRDPDVPEVATDTAVEASIQATRAALGLTGVAMPPFQTPTFQVDLIHWWAKGGPPKGVPPKQTLERLVSTALARAYPARGGSLEDWISTRPDQPPMESGKTWAYGYMAGWWPKDGADAYYRGLWKVDQIARELEILLDACGATAAITRLEP